MPEVGDERIRERFIYSYRLVYRVEPEQILIVAVIHGKRLLENVPERFDSDTNDSFPENVRGTFTP